MLTFFYIFIQPTISANAAPFQIHDHSTTSRNPQANTMCESMQQAVGNALQVLSTLNPPRQINEANQLVDTTPANAVYAQRTAYNSAINTTPGGLAFGYNMIVALLLIADLQNISAHCQQLIDQRLISANQRHFSYDYCIGDAILKLAYTPHRLAPRALTGPHLIEQVHTNGTMTIRWLPTVIKQILIQRI